MNKKTLLIAAALVATTAATAPAFAADVGVSISVGQPGFYGNIDIGNYPRPVVVYQQPVVIQPVQVGGPPLYLRVPPGHYKHWNKHCGEYNACGRPVYFVRDSWYNNVYAPQYRERHGNEHYDHRDHDRDGWQGRGGDDDHDHGRGDDHGHGRDH